MPKTEGEYVFGAKAKLDKRTAFKKCNAVLFFCFLVYLSGAATIINLPDSFYAGATTKSASAADFSIFDTMFPDVTGWTASAQTQQDGV